MTRLGRPRSEEVEHAIIQATTGLLAEVGYESLSMEAIAARAGVAKTTIYRRWDNKEDLVFAALAQLKRPLPALGGTDVRADMLTLLDNVRRQWTDSVHGELMHRLSVGGLDHPELYRQFRERLIAPRRAVMLGVLSRGRDEGLIRADVDLPLVLDLMIAPILSAAFTHQPLPTPAELRLIVDIVLAGVRPGAA